MRAAHRHAGERGSLDCACPAPVPSASASARLDVLLWPPVPGRTPSGRCGGLHSQLPATIAIVLLQLCVAHGQSKDWAQVAYTMTTAGTGSCPHPTGTSSTGGRLVTAPCEGWPIKAPDLGAGVQYPQSVGMSEDAQEQTIEASAPGDPWTPSDVGATWTEVLALAATTLTLGHYVRKMLQAATPTASAVTIAGWSTASRLVSPSSDRPSRAASVRLAPLWARAMAVGGQVRLQPGRLAAAVLLLSAPLVEGTMRSSGTPPFATDSLNYNYLRRRGRVVRGLYGTSVAVAGDGSRVAAGGPLGCKQANQCRSTSTNFGRGVVTTWDVPLSDGAGFKGPQKFIEGDEGTSDNLGSAVALSYNGAILATGAKLGGGASHGVAGPGYVRVWDFIDSNWAQKGSTLSGDADGDGFGSAVALSSSGSVMVVGAPNKDVGGNVDAGLVRGAPATRLSPCAVAPLPGSLASRPAPRTRSLRLRRQRIRAARRRPQRRRGGRALWQLCLHLVGRHHRGGRGTPKGQRQRRRPRVPILVWQRSVEPAGRRPRRQRDCALGQFIIQFIIRDSRPLVRIRRARGGTLRCYGVALLRWQHPGRWRTRKRPDDQRHE